MGGDTAIRDGQTSVCESDANTRFWLLARHHGRVYSDCGSREGRGSSLVGHLDLAEMSRKCGIEVYFSSLKIPSSDSPA